MEHDHHTDDKKLFRVLSIDGGGIKGLIPLFFCDTLEKISGKKIYDLFDFFTGTSIGGIISLFFSQRIYTAGELLVLMLGELKNKIFPSKRYVDFVLYGQSFYDPKHIEDAFKTEFKEISFKDAQGSFLITGSKVNKDVCTPFVFTSFKGEKGAYSVTSNPKEQDFFIYQKEDILPDDFKIADIARITSAAFPYFNVYDKIKDHTFVDGGFTFNNPSFLALKYLQEIRKIDPKNISMISLGCSKDIYNVSVDIDTLNDSLFKLRPPILTKAKDIGELMDNLSYNTLMLADSLLGHHHIRVAPFEQKEVITLDEVDKISINKLKFCAMKMVTQSRRFSQSLQDIIGFDASDEFIKLNNKMRFYYYPRFIIYNRFYEELKQNFEKLKENEEEVKKLLKGYAYPEILEIAQPVVKVTQEKSLFDHILFRKAPERSLLCMALELGFLPAIEQFRHKVHVFEYEEYESFNLFHIAAANDEISGLLLLLEEEYLVPGSLKKFDNCFNFELKADLAPEKLLKLINKFITFKGVQYDYEEALDKQTPLGYAHKNDSRDTVLFFNKLVKLHEGNKSD